MDRKPLSIDGRGVGGEGENNRIAITSTVGVEPEKIP